MTESKNGGETDPLSYNEDFAVDENKAVVEAEAAAKEDKAKPGQFVGAAVVGGVVGLVVGGPLIAVGLGAGAVALAATKTRAGKVTRQTGGAVASVGGKVRQVDQKHHISEKTGNAFKRGWKFVSGKGRTSNEEMAGLKSSSTGPAPSAPLSTVSESDIA
eukprot:CAMPEP_0194031512 /NCGR_PEP_ID=MMETSP0009_2-20130614/4672_1 /TAXON_ID=210454 /ORGANISM="Grammatophora oceanica, Strain CCMP 410" /LENGTH=159 /DNA_ID=CAMNT_0038671693 /DNA_START=119 /DNA_END=594 /DNA_ORIENTATION=+